MQIQSVNTAFTSFANYGIPSLSIKLISHHSVYVIATLASHVTDHYKHQKKYCFKNNLVLKKSCFAIVVHESCIFCHCQLSVFPISFDFLA